MIDIKRFLKQHTSDDIVTVRQFIYLHVKDEAFERYAEFVDSTGKNELEVKLFHGMRVDSNEDVYAFIVTLENEKNELHFMVDEKNMRITFKEGEVVM